MRQVSEKVKNCWCVELEVYVTFFRRKLGWKGRCPIIYNMSKFILVTDHILCVDCLRKLPNNIVVLPPVFILVVRSCLS